jgi:hypothetical protein
VFAAVLEGVKMGPVPENLIGRKYTWLTVLSGGGKDKSRNIIWECQCICGKKTIVAGSALRAGRVKSCGCLRDFKSRQRKGRLNKSYCHGMCRTPEYKAFYSAKNRCTNTETKNYADYGGRGIQFKFISFEEFLSHIGVRPSSKHSLDRIDNDGNYELGNVRWATKEQQMHNRRIKRLQEFTDEEIQKECERRNRKDTIINI